MRRIRDLACALLVSSMVGGLVHGGKTEYDLARDAYKHGDHVAARLYFESMLRNPDHQQYFPDAVYYLVLINEQRGDVVEFITQANRYLKDYSFGARASEVMELLLERLVKERAYQIGAMYLRKYEYLAGDALIPIMEELSRGLIAQGEFAPAEYVLSFCAQTDTVKILRASITEDPKVRDEIYQTLQGPGSGRGLYITENQLSMGDTVGAFLTFRPISAKALTGDALYRYAKIALLFDRASVPAHAARLRDVAPYKHRAGMLEAIAKQEPVQHGIPVPADSEEIALCLRILSMDGVAKNVPENLVLDSAMTGFDDPLDRLKELRHHYPGHYLLDSLYSWQLVRRGDYKEAAEFISPYLKYANAQAYARKIIGLQYYTEGDHEAAATNIILANSRDPLALFVLAECLSAMGHHTPDFFGPAMAQSDDPDLFDKALRGYVLDRYRAEAYEDICAIESTALKGDTALVRLYARSLARCGALSRADSVRSAHFADPDLELFDLYGEYLIDRKEYHSAAVHYDSLIEHGPGYMHDGMHYNWAVVTLLNNDMDAALQRFRSYAERFPRGRHFHDALFKIATLNFLSEQFDSAAVYYGLASADQGLMADALENQLISYKKAGRWSMVIGTGLKISKTSSQEREADIRFEIGYASLRAGRAADAIENLRIATRLRPEPSYYYWLGEAYLGKGDFAAAFHSYQKILDSYGDDEMWAPTAQYKTGIVLELLDELDAAQHVYEKIMKQRGVNDPIGAEADTRLKMLRQ
ncbi:tetratricopeptide repeat protein [candidate division WOR-3 bacterium]|nr:tetratricopeptide repeat protein [candidate division WOR-3 bacterium]